MRHSLGVELELMPVWPEIIFGGHMDNPTDNLFKLSYVFHDAARQAREAGLDAANLERIASRIPKPTAAEMKERKAGLELPPEHWEILHHAFLHAAAEGKGWAFGEAMSIRRFGFDGDPPADITDPEVIAGIATSVGLDGDATAGGRTQGL